MPNFFENSFQSLAGYGLKAEFMSCFSWLNNEMNRGWRKKRSSFQIILGFSDFFSGMINSFTVRVYGIYLENDKNILVSHEKIGEKWYCKFPGGGLEFGEGTLECLRREWKEELSADIDIGSHFYTTDFFVQSNFNPNKQVISIYYFITKFNGSNLINNLENQWFEFIELVPKSMDKLSFSTDKAVFEKLIHRNTSNLFN